MKKIKIHPKKERFIFLEKGFYTNGYWALKQEFCEEIWEKDLRPPPCKIESDIFKLCERAFEDAVELTPSCFVVDTNKYQQGKYARRYDSALHSSGEVMKVVHIDEIFHLMFKKATGYKFKFFGSSLERPILITTHENEFVGVVMGMRVDEERR